MTASRKVFILNLPAGTGAVGARAIAADGVTVVSDPNNNNNCPSGAVTKSTLAGSFYNIRAALNALPGVAGMKAGYGWDDVSNGAVIMIDCRTEHVTVSLRDGSDNMIKSDLVFSEAYVAPVDLVAAYSSRFAAMTIASANRS